MSGEAITKFRIDHTAITKGGFEVGGHIIETKAATAEQNKGDSENPYACSKFPLCDALCTVCDIEKYNEYEKKKGIWTMSKLTNDDLRLERALTGRLPNGEIKRLEAALAERDEEIAILRKNNRELTDKRFELMEEIARLREVLYVISNQRRCELCDSMEIAIEALEAGR